jgi:hypothetical protein
VLQVKYSPPKQVKKSLTPIGRERAASDISARSEDEEAQVEPEKKGKICEALSILGIYTRSCHFSSLDQPEATMPTHVFAVSETKFLALQEEQRAALIKHNSRFFMRCYPKGKILIHILPMILAHLLLVASQ